jgi:KDO2-lipid IV(A) lauroyltransferase
VARGLKTRALLLALHTLSAATRVIPRHSVGEPICRIVGLGWYLAAPSARAAVRDNLRHVLGREPARAEVRRVFWYGALNYWDTFAIPHVGHQALLDLVDIHGAEHIEAALAHGKGVITATAHLGSVSFVGQVMPALGYRMTGLLEPIEPPEVFEFFAAQRQAQGARLLAVGTGAMRELLLALRRNEMLGLVTDRDVTGTGPMISFFDAPTRFPDGGAALAVRTGAPVLIAVSIRKPDGRFDALISPLPPVVKSGDTKADVLAVTQAIARGLEYHVANHPEQWTVFQKRWPEARPG